MTTTHTGHLFYGSVAPSAPTHAELGSCWWDTVSAVFKILTSKSPYTWTTTGGGASTFLALTDTPGSYATHSGKNVRVNAGESALEFIAPGAPGLHDTTHEAGGSDVVDAGFIRRTADPATPAVGETWINAALLKYRDNQATPATQTLQKRGDVITDAEHGARGAIANAHAHTDLASVTADQHHAQAHTYDSADHTGALTHNTKTDNPTAAHGATGAVVGTTNTQELTNKTLNNPKIKDVDATPVEDVLIKAVDAVVQFRNLADTTDRQISGDAKARFVTGVGAHTHATAGAEGGQIDHAVGITNILANQHHAQLHKAAHEVGGGDLVDHNVLTNFAADRHRQLLIGTLAARPAAATADRFYWATDTKELFRDTGAAWDEVTIAHADLTGVTTDQHHAQLHKAAHVSGGGDAFAATDLLEALAKRIRESGGADLAVGAISDGQNLQRSGLTIIGVAPGGGGGITWRQITTLAAGGGTTMTNIGTTFKEVGAASVRVKADLTGFTDCRICTGVNKVGTGTQDWRYQYSTDETTWVDLTPVVSDAGAAGEKVLVGAFGAIPAAAKADVFIRLVGRSTVGTDDPIVRSAHMQYK